jgi:hypothetical protein
VVVGHNWAMPSGFDETKRDRAAVPPPQATEHSPQAAQLPMTQSAQDTDEQEEVLASAGHSRPPAEAASIKGRMRCELPNAQPWSQKDQAPQLPILQSIGQVPTPEHARTSPVEVHAAPPADDGDVIARARPCVPEPHVTEQTPHACQALITQSMGHAAVEHCSVSVSEGHATPPLLTAVEIVR